MSPFEPLEQDETLTLEAELRQAVQHLRAAQAQVADTQASLAETIQRAREILGRRTPASPIPLENRSVR
jgi:hypothetical protein